MNRKRKRKNDSSDQPNKRRKLNASSSLQAKNEEKKKYKIKYMRIRIEELKNQIKDLEEKNKNLTKKDVNYDSCVAVIDRSWKMFEDGIIMLLGEINQTEEDRVTITNDSHVVDTIEKNKNNNNNEDDKMEDEEEDGIGFLQSLVQTIEEENKMDMAIIEKKKGKAKRRIKLDVPEVVLNEELTKKYNKTKELLKNFIEYVVKERKDRRKILEEVKNKVDKEEINKALSDMISNIQVKLSQQEQNWNKLYKEHNEAKSLSERRKECIIILHSQLNEVKKERDELYLKYQNLFRRQKRIEQELEDKNIEFDKLETSTSSLNMSSSSSLQLEHSSSDSKSLIDSTDLEMKIDNNNNNNNNNNNKNNPSNNNNSNANENNMLLSKTLSTIDIDSNNNNKGSMNSSSTMSGNGSSLGENSDESGISKTIVIEDGNNILATLQEKINEIEKISNNRLDEISAIVQEKAKLQEEISALKQQLIIIPSDKIFSSDIYKNCEIQVEILESNNTALHNQFNTLKAKYQTLEATSNQEIENLRETFNEIRIRLEKELSEATNSYIKTVKDKNSAHYQMVLMEENQKSFKQTRTELNKLVETQQSELKKLRTSISKLQNDKNLLNSNYESLIKQYYELKKHFENQKLELENKTKTLSNFDSLLSTNNDNITEESNNDNLSLNISKINDMFTQLKTLKELNISLQTEIKSLSSSQDNSSPNGNLDKYLNLSKQLTDLENLNKKLSTNVSDLTSQLEKVTSNYNDQFQENEALSFEIEDISKELEQIQDQNTSLLSQLNEKDDSNAQLMSERVKSTQVQNLLREEKELLLNKNNSLDQVCRQAHESLMFEKQQNKNFRDQIKKLQEQSRITIKELESTKKNLSEQQKKTVILSQQKESLTVQIDDLTKLSISNSSDLEIQNNNVKRLQEDNDSMRKKLDRLSKRSNGSKNEVDPILEAELKNYQHMVTCPVCNDQLKDCVIVKCGHVFCSDCINRTLRARHRKCPGCGNPFANQDVSKIYLN